jgi:D-alanyl-D-alanine carboxypeptidase/D-alanyl-D-alanine-endopeptidase (penicillin-binding protein 4)
MRGFRARAGALLVLGVLVTAPQAAGAAVAPATRALTSLRHALNLELRRAGGNSSAVVVDTTTGQTLYSVAPNAPRLPASVEKLYTTSAALVEYGPSATFATAVFGTGSLTPDGDWQGTLYLHGGGDPTFGSAAFDRAAYGTGATVQVLAASVRAAGIRRVDGAIVGDGTVFDTLRGTPATGFAPDLELEGQLGGLVYDAGFTSPFENALQPRPALFATQAFVAALRAAGVQVPGSTPIWTGGAPPSASLVASVASPPIAQLVQLTNAPSDNFFAETLLKDVGFSFGDGGTTAAGAAVVQSTIATAFHLHPRFDDGSGLSRFDRTTAAQVVSLLEQQADDQPFVDSLAVAGVDGTMQHEMRGTPAAGNCRGKTGTLSDVASLVGYCTSRNRDQLVFAFLENSIANTDAGHLTEDAMGAKLAEYNPLTGAG